MRLGDSGEGVASGRVMVSGWLLGLLGGANTANRAIGGRIR